MTIKVTYNVTDVYMSQSVSPVYINVSYSDGGASGGGVWGSITGTLSNQTDLQNALNAKFDDPTGTTTQYIDGTGALQTFPLTLPVLQEVRNQTGATLDAGTVVYINGATGNKPTVTKAIATGDATSAQTLGMISSAISNNGVGYVVVIGTCGGLDTSAYTEGQQLYLSGTVAGGVTTTKPYAPIHLVYVGIVTRSHPTLGTVEVRVQNGFEMDEIHNVSAQTPSNNDGLFYNTTTSLWESKAITTALGYTPVPTTRNITINGVTYDLSADRTWTISTGISGSGASGQVTYWTGASAVSGSNNLFWDNANGRLGIGTNVPTSALHVTSTTWNSTQPFISFINLDPQGAESKGLFVQAGALSASSYIANFANYSGTSFFYLDGTGNLGIKTTSPAYTLDVADVARFRSQIRFATDIWNVSHTDSANRLFFSASGSTFFGSASGYSWQNSSSSNIMTLFSTGNLVLQNGGTFTDSGQRLQVIGDTLLRGSGATSATTALTVQNSSSTNLFRVLNDGKINFSNTGIPANTSIFVNIANGYVNYGSSYSNAPFFTYQAYGSWESIGADSSTGTILAVGGYRASQWAGITLHANGNEVMRVKQNGQVRFVPLASAPASPQAGDVYYDSTLNKLRVYTTAWETITSI